MAKKKKGCLIFVGVFVAGILFFVCSVYYNMATSRERNERDDINCANTSLIESHPLISISDSSISVNQKIEVFVMDGNSIIEKAEIKNKSAHQIEFNIPFQSVKKSNQILVVAGHKKYLITDMKYFNDGHWGMFGYLGENCRFSYQEKLSE